MSGPEALMLTATWLVVYGLAEVVWSLRWERKAIRARTPALLIVDEGPAPAPAAKRPAAPRYRPVLVGRAASTSAHRVA